MKRRDSWSTEEWIHELDNVISMGRGWLGGLPPRSEGEIPSANAAKQLAEEACEFASCISVLSISITKCPRMRTCGHGHEIRRPRSAVPGRLHPSSRTAWNGPVKPRQRAQWANQPPGPACTTSYRACPTGGSTACTTLAC